MVFGLVTISDNLGVGKETDFVLPLLTMLFLRQTGQEEGRKEEEQKEIYLKRREGDVELCLLPRGGGGWGPPPVLTPIKPGSWDACHLSISR